MDTPNRYSTVTTRSQKPRASFVRSNANATLRSVRSLAASNVQVADAEMAAEMASNHVADLRGNQPTVRVQESTNLPVTYRQADFSPVSRENDEFPHDSNKFHGTTSHVQRMLDSVML